MSETRSYYVDEAGDGVLFGAKGRNRLDDPDAQSYFMLGMIRCADDATTGARIEALRTELLANPLYAGIPSMQPAARKTARAFHAKDDHPEVRSRVFDFISQLDFKFYAVIKDMRKVRDYVLNRNAFDSTYRYHPNELYDLTVRMLFKERLHKGEHVRVMFARRGKSDRTAALTTQLERTRAAFLSRRGTTSETTLAIKPVHACDDPCVQLADYCLWALQRCYEKHEGRFLQSIWSKVSLLKDVDDPDAPARYGSYLTAKQPPPDPRKIKNRWI